MEPTNSKLEEKDLPAVPEKDGTLSVDDLEKVSGGRTSDPCEGGQFHSN